jgi:NitT/TauT family transport system substrate-binding protein
MHSRKHFLTFLFSTILCLPILCCQRQTTTPDTPRKPFKATLRLKWIYDPGFAGEMVAARSHFFTDSGLELELKPGGFEADPIKLVASGSDTFGVAGADSFLLARAKGVPIVAFAAGYLQTPVVFYVHENSGIKSPADFAGKKVGYQAGQDTATVYETLLKKIGISRSLIKEIPVKYDFTPFLTGRVDVWPGYAATQSYILQRQKVPYNVIRPGQYGLAYLGTVYFTSERFLSEHPEIVQAFVDGLIRGWEYTYAHEDSAIPLIASYDSTNLTPDLIRFNLDRQKEFIHPSGTQYCAFDQTSWTSLDQSLVEVNLLTAQVDLGPAITMKFLDTHYRRPR